MANVKENRIIIIISILFVFLFLWLNVSNINLIAKLRNALESPFIESRVIVNRTPWNKAQSNIVIIDIDKASLEQIGPWPWRGDKLTLLSNKLINSGASIILFDIVFDKHSKNSAAEVIKHYKKLNRTNSVFLRLLNTMVSAFDYDGQFAKSLSDHEVVTGFLFHKKEFASTGLLPPPLSIKNKIHLRSVNRVANYQANIAVIQKATPFGAYINLPKDRDGIFRRVPLITQYGYQLYPALALQAARVQQITKRLRITHDPNDVSKLNAIYIDEVQVPVDQHLTVMPTYRGPRNSFPRYSAIDLIEEKFDLKKLERKTVIIGSSEPHIRPLIRTLAGKFFTSAEVHANLISSILSNQLLSRPSWIIHFDNFLLLTIGVALCFVFSYLTLRQTLLVTVGVCTLWLFYNYWLYTSEFILTSISIPLAMVLTLTLINSIAKHGSMRFRVQSAVAHWYRKLIKKSPPTANEEPLGTTIEETATLLVLDIRNFNEYSEKLSANQLNRMLNMVIAPITELIEAHHGTINQYLGHRLLATWSGPGNALAAVSASHNIVHACQALKPRLKQKNLPEANIAIGINTGKIRFKTISFNASIIYGQAVNIAAKLADLTQFYQVHCLVGEHTQQEITDFQFREIDSYLPARSQTSMTLYEPIIDKNKLNVILHYELEHYQKALDYLNQNQLNEAKAVFNYLISLNVNRPLYRLFLERIDKLQQTQGEPIWQGPLNRRLAQ